MGLIGLSWKVIHCAWAGYPSFSSIFDLRVFGVELGVSSSTVVFPVGVLTRIWNSRLDVARRPFSSDVVLDTGGVVGTSVGLWDVVGVLSFLFTALFVVLSSL